MDCNVVGDLLTILGWLVVHNVCNCGMASGKAGDVAHKTIESMWLDYAGRFEGLMTAGDDQYEAMRTTFYCGFAYHFWAVEKMFNEHVNEDEGSASLALWDREITVFSLECLEPMGVKPS